MGTSNVVQHECPLLLPLAMPESDMGGVGAVELCWDHPLYFIVGVWGVNTAYAYSAAVAQGAVNAIVEVAVLQ